MPTDSQGQYSLPPGNPVTPNTVIESSWANGTMSDLADAMTGRLPRDGSAAMTGPLTLVAGDPALPRQAASKGYVDKFIAFASGMPIGSLLPYAGGSAPLGYLLCNGQTVSRATYADLFTAIGTIYGVGDGITTFNLPDMRDYFVRGRSSSRTVGSTQDSAFGTHSHAVSDPGHTHVVTSTPHTHVADPHTHVVTDPGHTHGGVPNPSSVINYGSTHTLVNSVSGSKSTNSAATGITLANTTVTMANATVVVNAANATTGVVTATAGDTETRPKNVAMDYYIKAVQDSAGNPKVEDIASSDTNCISVDATDAIHPILDVHTNTSLGLVKLDNNAKIPSALLPAGTQTFQGAYDASTGNNPSEEYPLRTFVNGDTYLIVVGGTINVYDPVTYVSAPTLVATSASLVYIDNGIDPVGWYYIAAAPAGTVIASGVSIAPISGMVAAEVQAALEELHATDVAIAVSALTTSNTATLTNKTINAATNTILNVGVDELLSSVAGTNVITATADAGIAAYLAGQRFSMVVANGNTGTVTVNVNALGAVALTWDGTTALAEGDLKAGQMVSFQYDGTGFQLASSTKPSDAPAGGSTDKVFYENDVTVAHNYTVTTGKNAGTFGPVTIASGVTVTVPTGSTWSIV